MKAKDIEEDHWWKGTSKSFSHPFNQVQVRKIALSTNFDRSNWWWLKIISFLWFQIDIVAATHQIFHFLLVALETANEECWVKLSTGLQCTTLASLTQELNSHHNGIIFLHEKKRWEADSTWLWQKVQRSLSRATCRLDRLSLVGSLSHRSLQAKDRTLGEAFIAHNWLKAWLL